jgi:hypothetical protein
MPRALHQTAPNLSPSWKLQGHPLGCLRFLVPDLFWNAMQHVHAIDSRETGEKGGGWGSGDLVAG